MQGWWGEGDGGKSNNHPSFLPTPELNPHPAVSKNKHPIPIIAPHPLFLKLLHLIHQLKLTRLLELLLKRNLPNTDPCSIQRQPASFTSIDIRWYVGWRHLHPFCNLSPTLTPRSRAMATLSSLSPPRSAAAAVALPPSFLKKLDMILKVDDDIDDDEGDGGEGEGEREKESGVRFIVTGFIRRVVGFDLVLVGVGRGVVGGVGSGILLDDRGDGDALVASGGVRKGFAIEGF
ncbi:hypothetical protein DM02DRAFT_80480 [Periconia macrospinosa]|uniref:Uncharacterized protein n=1 Tax=Periconia macrospinosa TaxID=97972 RepID=A0A2V1DHD5_9PLEO|nr:hypothetical protein DM02DRAFT_80480 [Periconia macrospinosa]